MFKTKRIPSPITDIHHYDWQGTVDDRNLYRKENNYFCYLIPTIRLYYNDSQILPHEQTS